MAADREVQNVVVQNPLGLHVRPAELVAKAAMQYQSQISLEVEGQTIDAKSILHIMTLGARQGSTVVIHAQGADAQQAVKELADLIGGMFDSDEDHSMTQDQAS